MADWGTADQGFGLDISSESKRSLGLDQSGSIRVTARAGRMLLLESADGNGPPVPWDRDLVLSGNVRSFPLADLLSLAHSAGKSGFLLFHHEADEKAIYLNRGEVVFAESNLRADRLGAYLLREQLIDQSQLELVERRYHPRTRFGKIIVELGILTPRDLWNAVKGQVEEIVRSLFTYTGGWIHFWEGDVEPDNVVRLSLPTNRLIEEGLERRDELLHFLARLEDGRVRIRPEREQCAVGCENERAMLAAIDGELAFGALCHRTGLDPRTAARTIQFLLLTGHVAIEKEDPGASSDFATADDDVVREAVMLNLKLIFELCAPLVALDGAVAVSNRLNRILEESVQHGRVMFQEIRFNEAGTLDPAEVAYQALRQPGDRLRELDEALGEVVTYLEFELRNHPGIPDCSLFLEAVDPLRAMLIR
ncbi:MAG: DUF4388 domain-containing protein [Myxococcota bacterium]